MPRPPRTIHLTGDQAQRFWNQVDLPVGESRCQPYRGTTDANGYGQVSVYDPQRKRDISYKAHRVAYVLTYGQTDGAVAHREGCITRTCCNPSHLTVVPARPAKEPSPTPKPGSRTHQTVLGPMTEKQQKDYAYALIGAYPNGNIPIHATLPCLPWKYAQKLPPIPDDDPIPQRLYDEVTKEQHP